MFNFNIEVQASKNKVVKYHCQAFYLNGIKVDSTYSLGLNAREANNVIEAIHDKASKQFYNQSGHLKTIDFDSFVKEIEVINKLRKDLVKLKEINCYSGKTLTDHVERVTKLINNFFHKVGDTITERFDAIQSHILYEVSQFGGVYYSYRLGHENTSYDKYDVIKDTTSEGDDNLEKALKFDYSKYNVNAASMITKMKEDHKNHIKHIEAFRFIKGEAGVEIVDWSKQKVTIRLRTKEEFKGMSSDSIYEYLDKYKEHLLNNGLATKTLKEDKKIPRFARLIKRLDAHEELEQDELICIIKSCNSVNTDHDVLAQLTKESLFSLMDIKTQSFAKKLGRGANLSGKIIAAMNEFKVNKKEYKRLIEFVNEHEKVAHVAGRFFEKNLDVFTKEFFKQWGRNYYFNMPNAFSPLGLDYLEKNFSTLEILKFNSDLTTGYMTERMTPQERLAIFRDNSIEISSPNQERIGSLVDDCSMESLTEAFKSSYKAMNNLCWVAHNKDSVDLANHYVRNSMSLDSSLISLNILTIADRDVFRERLQGDFTENRVRLLSQSFIGSDYCSEEYAMITLEETVKSGSDDARKLFDSACTKIGESNPKALNTFLRSLDKLYTFNYYNTEVLTKETRKHIASLDPQFIDPQPYRTTNLGYAENLVEFFKDFNRAEVEAIYSKEFMFTQFRYYFGHCMNSKELNELGNRDYIFLRLNLEHFNYGFLKKFKEKSLFKKVVGDRRDRRNKSFGEALLEKLEVSNTLEFMFN